MKGIVLAGGQGTRLYPNTTSVSKQLLPVYSKPLIYYPISTLLLSGIREILIITTPSSLGQFESLLERFNNLGIKIEFEIQNEPNGIAEAFLIGEKFIGKDDVCLILGDNIFYGNGLQEKLKLAVNKAEKGYGVVLSYLVEDPGRYGVIEFNKNGNVEGIEEKPKNPKSNYAATGLYFYPNDVVQIAKGIQPSNRGEKEITEVNNQYLNQKRLEALKLGRGFAWFDTGTTESLFQATEFVRAFELRQGMLISSLEEICYEMGYCTRLELLKFLETNKITSDYNKYLIRNLK